MGRKQGQPSTSKKPKEGHIAKPADLGRPGKKPLNKSTKTDGSKREPPRSKPGYSLYSASESDGSKTAKSKNFGQGEGGKRQQQSSEMNKKRDTEVMSQMQIQAERSKAAEASGIVIPTAGMDVIEDFTLIGSMDLPEVSTPFNKRLVSSTPDPERLLEAELLEQQRHALDPRFALNQQPPRSSPQMIPERDVATSIRASTVLTSVGSGLSEKLKQQRQQIQDQHLQKSEDQAQQSDRPSPQQWKHHLQQYQQDNEHIQGHYTVASKEWDSQQHENPQNNLSQPLSGPLIVSKAEWVEDSPQKVLSPRSDTVHDTDRKLATYGHNAPTSLYNTYGLTSSSSSSRTVLSTNDNPLSARSPNDYKPLTITSEEISPHTIYPASNLNSVQEKGNHEKLASVKQTFPSSTITSSTVNSAFNVISNSDRSSKAVVPHVRYSSQNVLHNNTPLPVVSTFPATIFKSNQNVQQVTPIVSPAKALPSRKIALPKVSQDLKKISKEKKKNPVDKRGEDIPPRAIPVVSIPTGREEKPEASNDQELDMQDLNSSADTCDLEVNDVISKSIMDKSSSNEPSTQHNMVENGNETPERADRASASSTSSNLSQVIEFLKTGAFNGIEITKANDDLGDTDDDDDVDKTVTERDNDSEQTEKQKYNQAVCAADDLKKEESIATNVEYSLSQLISQYLPKNDKPENTTNCNSGQKNAYDKDAEKMIEDTNHQDKDFNQNARSNVKYSRHREARPLTRTPKNLHFLEKMADPRLRDIACQLAFKATALRDLDLRDLIDDMIFHTDAALGREDARFQSAQMFFAEENSKLKKRIQTINRQLETKERQERMGGSALGISNNDVLQLERKIMYLRQEKDKLDTQVTTLLEEKAKWLITQQDLIKTISLKDHELLKLEEKNHEEKKALLQSLDQATKNSQGVHYKLSVADREISNLEQRLKCKDLDIGDLKEKLKEMEAKWRICEAHSSKKDQEMLRLQDLVDTLKIGVDHVLQAYELSTNSHLSTTAEQRQGIENLRQMVHPEQYSLYRTASESEEIRRLEQNVFHEGEPYAYHHSSEIVQQRHGERDAPIRPQPLYPKSHPPGLSQRLRNLSKDEHSSKLQSMRTLVRSEGRRDEPISHLTSRALEEHNKRLSPIDRSLWRSLDDGPVATPIQGEEPYYSDSEIHVNSRPSYRRSSQRYSNAAARDFRPFNQQSRLADFRETVIGTHRKYQDVNSRDPQSQSQELDRSIKQSMRKHKRRKSESDKYNYRDMEDKNTMTVRRVDFNDDTLATVSVQSWAELEVDGNNEDDHRLSETEYSRKYPNFHTSEPHTHRKSDRRRESQTTQCSTLRSLTLPDSSSTRNEREAMSRDAYCSTLKSKSLSDDPLYYESQQESHHRAEPFDTNHRSSHSKLNLTSHPLRYNHHLDSFPSSGHNQSLLKDSRESSGQGAQVAAVVSDNDPHFSRQSSNKDSHESDTVTQYVTLRLDQSSGSGYTSSNRVSIKQPQHYASHHFRSHSHDDVMSGESLEIHDPDYYHHSLQGRNSRSLNEWQQDLAEESDIGRLSVSLPHSQRRHNYQQDSQQRESYRDIRGNPSQSDFFSARSSLPTHSSPVHTSDISVSRRATRGSDSENITQRDFFQGTELSASLSSISVSDVGSHNSNEQLSNMDEDPFSSGIATLDAKIAMLQKKIDRTKAMFS